VLSTRTHPPHSHGSNLFAPSPYAVCCSVLQRVAACCSVSDLFPLPWRHFIFQLVQQPVDIGHSVVHRVHPRHGRGRVTIVVKGAIERDTVRVINTDEDRVLQCVAVCCSVLQCVAVCCVTVVVQDTVVRNTVPIINTGE